MSQNKNIFELPDSSESRTFADRLSEILGTLKVPVTVLQPETDASKKIVSFSYIFSNSAADAISDASYAGRRIFQNDDPLVFNYAEKVFNTGMTEDVLFHHEKQGKWFHLIVANICNVILVMKDDITHIKLREQSAKIDKEKIDRVESATQTGTFTWQLASGSVYVSREMQNIYGIPHDRNQVNINEIMSQMYGESSLRARKKLQNPALLPDAAELSYKIRLEQGTIKHVRMITETIRDANNKAVSVLGICQDISQSNAAEEKLGQIKLELEKSRRELEKLHAQINLHQSIIDKSFEAVIGINKKGEIISWNHAAETLYGINSDYAIGRNFGTIVFETRRDEINQIIESSIKKNKGLNVKMENVRRDGSHFSASITIIPYQDVNKRNAGIYALVIPEAVSKDFALNPVANTPDATDSGVLPQSATEPKVTTALPDKIAIINAAEKAFLYTNDDVFWTGIFPLQIEGRTTPFENLVAIQDRETVLEHMRASLDNMGSEVLETKFETNDGKSFSLRTQLFKTGGMPDGNRLLSIASDITASHTIEARRDDSSTLLETIAAASPDIFFVMDIDTKEIKYTNREPAQVLGYDFNIVRLMRHPLFDIMSYEDIPAFLDHLEAMKDAADGEILEIEYRLQAADGTMHWFRDRNTVYKRDQSGVPIEKMGISQDNTARRNAEESILKLNKSLDAKNRELSTLNDELTTFTSIAAYDFRDTLQTLYTNMEYIVSRDAANLSNTAKGNLRKSQAAIQKMKLIAEDIVTISKIDADETSTEMIDLNKLVNDIFEELKNRIVEAGAKLTVSDLPTVQGNPFLLKLLIYHLIDNAVKFRHHSRVPEICINSHIDKKIISVTDNGIGIPEQECENVFKMFYRVNDKAYRGSGVGLAISKKVMDLHGGSIEAESHGEGGTTIKIQFSPD